MKLGECHIRHDHAYLLPISDCHIGDKCFDKKSETLLKGNIDWVAERENARVFLNGDILNVATRSSKSNPFDQTMPLEEQIEYATKLFSPIKDKIVGAITGNHEQRIAEFTGFDPTTVLCFKLGVPYYKHSAVVVFVVGDSEGRGNKNSYTGYFHHTTGGGGSVGSKLNRINKMRELCCNADFYCGSHNHQLAVVPVTTNFVDTTHRKVTRLRQLLVDTGSYLTWNDSYAEKMMLQPVKLGSPRLRLASGYEKDIHASV